MLSNLRQNKNLERLSLKLITLRSRKPYLLFKTIALYPNLKELIFDFNDIIISLKKVRYIASLKLEYLKLHLKNSFINIYPLLVVARDMESLQNFSVSVENFTFDEKVVDIFPEIQSLSQLSLQIIRTEASSRTDGHFKRLALRLKPYGTVNFRTFLNCQNRFLFIRQEEGIF